MILGKPGDQMGCPRGLFIHNHPSGDATPSRADIQMTQQIVEIARPLVRHCGARPHHCRQGGACKPQGAEVDLGRPWFSRLTTSADISNAVDPGFVPLPCPSLRAALGAPRAIMGPVPSSSTSKARRRLARRTQAYPEQALSIMCRTQFVNGIRTRRLATEVATGLVRPAGI
jgi:hypothetical protein